MDTAQWSTDDFDTALKVLRNGGVILYPTDTVWGIGCDATIPQAVERIFAIKHRADSKAMLSLVESTEALSRYVDGTSIEAAAGHIDPSRPTTVIYPRVKGISPALIAPDGSAGFRVCKAPFTAELCRCLGHPIVSTSANISGEPSPAGFADISPEIVTAMDYVVEHGRHDGKGAIPSRIILLNPDGTVAVIRQ